MNHNRVFNCNEVGLLIAENPTKLIIFHYHNDNCQILETREKICLPIDNTSLYFSTRHDPAENQIMDGLMVGKQTTIQHFFSIPLGCYCSIEE